MRGLETQHSGLRLRVNLLVARQDLSHVDTLDLYTARQRYVFLKQAAAELYVDEAVLKRDLGRVLWQLEEHQERQQMLCAAEAEVPVMSEEERREAPGAPGGSAADGSASWPTTKPAAWWAKRPASWSATWPAPAACCRGPWRC